MAELRVPIRQSLSYRQTRNTVIVAFVIGVILSTAQIYLDYFSQKSEIQESVRNTISTANRAAYHAAFNIDELAATQITRGLVSTAPIVDATILDQDEVTLGTATRESEENISSATRWLFGVPERISIGLINESEHEEPVGSLILTVDPALTASSFVQRATVVFLSGVLRNFILALCLIAVFYYTTTRPILAASAPIQRGAADQEIPLPAEHKHDEIGVLIGAFNEHLSTIDAQTQQIREANENLEKLVAQRTAQLAQKNEELMHERELALEASQSKSDFLAMMSHEIRTPMHGILGMAELLGESELNDQQGEYVEALTDSGRSLLALMNSVLDYAKYEQGHLELQSENFELHRLIGGIIFLLNPAAEAKHILLSSHIDDLIPPLIKGDAEKLRQVLLNLLTNAIKFTEEGEISLHIRKLAAGSSEQIALRIEVIDTGPGIPEEAQSRIFTPFRQADSKVAMRHGGSGLGLSICREIILAQGGKIDFETIPGEGSTFWFEVSYDQADPNQTVLSSLMEIPTAPLHPATILVVDDVAINRRLVEGQLKKHGYQVLGAADGEEALAVLNTEEVDLVLMDLQMPVMDGLEATRRIRESDVRIASIPVIGVTANLSADRHDSCLEAGMTTAVAKPLDALALRRLLSQYLPPLGTNTSGDSTSEETTAEQPLIDPAVFGSHAEALGRQQVDSLYSEAVEILRDRATDLVKRLVAGEKDAHDDAHALAGLCSNYGLARLGRLCENLEKELLDGHIEKAASQSDELKSLAGATVSAVHHTLQRVA